MSANFLRKSLYAASLLVLSGVVAFTPSLQPAALAQTNISGNISGIVTDPAGAAIPNATVTVTSKSTGSGKTISTGGRGEYTAPLLAPGEYEITVAAAGFEGAKTSVAVAAGGTSSADIKLTVGKATTTVDVTSAQPLLHTEDAQISTSFTMEQVQSLPNPGNDLTFVAQTSPGAVMNTQGGYGNFSVFGLPAVSNTFTVNGGYQNDPFLNLNNSGATNLLLGNNDIADVTVTSNAYDAAFGGLGGAQINEISRSGGNGFHGNASYWWNGSSLNANDWFKNNNALPKSFDNVNQWAAGIGGPIKKDKMFFFGDYEGLRVVLPTSSFVYAPSQATVNTILATVPSSETAAYQGLLNQWTNAPGYASAQPVTGFPGYPDGEFVSFLGTAGNFTHEWLATGRFDWNIGPNDKLFIHGKVDKGLQATFTSLLNPIYNADSPQPEYNGEFNETHTFTPNLTNQFLFALEYYRALFTNTSLDEANAITPFAIAGFFDSPLSQNGSGGLPGGLDFVWPQGRMVTNYQFADDLSWTKGNHTIKLGWSIRRDDVSDFDPGVYTTPIIESTFESFASGYTDFFLQAYPNRLSQPIALYNMGGYVQDTWKALPNLTVTYGIRLEHNSNPTCLTNCFGYANGDFYSLPDTPGPNYGINDTPFNELLASNQHRAFPNLQKVGYEPRMGFSWQPLGAGTHTVIRGGFGMFTDVFPATVADNLLNNAPLTVQGQTLGPAYGGPNYLLFPNLAPSAGNAGSANVPAVAGAAAVKAGFASGASADSIGFQPNLVTAATTIKYPTYEEWNLAVEQQLNRNTALAVMYVGNHGYHEPVVNGGANGFQLGNINGDLFTGSPVSYPTDAPNSGFGQATLDYAGATSNYNGLITTITHHERYVTLQLNYAYSHSLDEISNGGFLGFGGNAITPINPYNLSQNYGNADYDTRHYISGSYVVDVPYYGGPHVLTDNWEIAGTVFHNNGYPFSLTDSPASLSPGSCTDGTGLNCYNFINGAGDPLAAQIGTSFPTHCGGSGAAFRTAGGAAPCGFAAVGGNAAGLQNYNYATGFGQQHRNQLYGSSYTDADLDISKGFKIPGWESARLKAGAQFFNMFNHPNFGQPYHDLANGAGNIGTIPGLQNTPTSILGAFLGGDASPRLIQLKATFVF
jgi:hypothetical protein